MRVAPNPRTFTGWFGASPHASGIPCGLSSGFPVARRVPPLRPPSSGFPSSGVLRLVPFGRCPVPVPLRFPSSFPFPWAIFTLARPRGDSAGVGPGRQGPRSPVLPRPPRLDRAIASHHRWAAAGHDGMSLQNHLLGAAASAGHHRNPTAQIGGSACSLVAGPPRQWPRHRDTQPAANGGVADLRAKVPAGDRVSPCTFLAIGRILRVWQCPVHLRSTGERR